MLLGQVDYDPTFDSDPDFIIRVIILTSNQDTPTALTLLVDFLETSGTKSVRAAIEGDKTMGGKCGDSRLVRSLGFGSTQLGRVTYLSTEFEVKTHG